MNKGSIVERLCSDLDRKEPRYKSPTLYSTVRLTTAWQMLHWKDWRVQRLSKMFPLFSDASAALQILDCTILDSPVSSCRPRTRYSQQHNACFYWLCNRDSDYSYHYASLYRALNQQVLNPLTPSVAIWVQLQSILCQTGLSRHFVIIDILAL